MSASATSSLLSGTQPGDVPIAVFDLDGTLADSAPDIATAINRSLASRGLLPLTVAEVTTLLGNGLKILAQRAFAMRHATIEEDEVHAFIAHCAAHPVSETRLYPDVEDVLAQLAQDGWRMAVCTNKAETAAIRVLEELGIHHYFDAICGGDMVTAQKPHAAHLLATLERSSASTEQAIMIGDNPADVAVARACRVPCIFAAWGYGVSKTEGEDVLRAERVAELPSLLGELYRRRKRTVPA